MILAYLIMILMAGGIIAWIAGRKKPELSKWISALTLIIDFVIILVIWTGPAFKNFSYTSEWAVEFVYPWIPSLGISFHLALDGLNVILLALTFFLGIISVLVSWTQVKKRTGFFYFNILWILAGITGVFLAMDLFLFYFFWEVMLIPMYFIISIWGYERRIYASYKFFLFTQASGLFMLLSIIGLYFINGTQTGIYSFDFNILKHTVMSKTVSWFILSGFIIAFIVKLPAVPFHNWLPDAHTEAPTAGSVILAGLMLKTGAYGLIRFVVPVFYEIVLQIAPYAMIVGMTGILYGAVLSFAQSDMKRLVAYTSVSHMGFVLMGIFALNEPAYQGTVMQMVAHGISTGALFVIVGMLQERTHTRNIDEFTGLWFSAPKMGAVMLVFAMASLGLPGMANFIAEFLILLGSFKAQAVITIIASAGLILATVYSLRIFQKVFHGKTGIISIKDLNLREIAVMFSMVIIIFWLGLFPGSVMKTSEAPVQKIMENYGLYNPVRSVIVNSDSAFLVLPSVSPNYQINTETER